MKNWKIMQHCRWLVIKENNKKNKWKALFTHQFKLLQE